MGVICDINEVKTWAIISRGILAVQGAVSGAGGAGKLSQDQLTAAAPSTDRTQDQDTVTAHNVTSRHRILTTATLSSY